MHCFQNIAQTKILNMYRSENPNMHRGTQAPAPAACKSWKSMRCNNIFRCNGAPAFCHITFKVVGLSFFYSSIYHIHITPGPALHFLCPLLQAHRMLDNVHKLCYAMPIMESPLLHEREREKNPHQGAIHLMHISTPSNLTQTLKNKVHI